MGYVQLLLYPSSQVMDHRGFKQSETVVLAESRSIDRTTSSFVESLVKCLEDDLRMIERRNFASRDLS